MTTPESDRFDSKEFDEHIQQISFTMTSGLHTSDNTWQIDAATTPFSNLPLTPLPEIAEDPAPEAANHRSKAVKKPTIEPITLLPEIEEDSALELEAFLTVTMKKPAIGRITPRPEIEE